MFWSNDKLKSELPHIIKRYDLNNVSKSNYTLHIGKEVYITPNGDPSKLGKDRQILLSENQYFEIPPGQFAFLLTKERVCTPLNVLAFISVRATYKFKGLVNVSGFHVDPGYNGHLVFAVFNAGPTTVTLSEGAACFHIWFADLDGNSNKITKPGYDRIPADLVSEISDTNVSLSSLNSELSKLNIKVNAFSIVATLIIGLFGAALVNETFFNKTAPNAQEVIHGVTDNKTKSDKK